MSSDRGVQEIVDLRSMVDEHIEEALVKRVSIGELLAGLLPSVCDKLGASTIVIETFGGAARARAPPPSSPARTGPAAS